MTSFGLVLLPLFAGFLPPQHSGDSSRSPVLADPCVRVSSEDTLTANDTIPSALASLRIPGAQKYCTVLRDAQTGRNALHFGIRGSLNGASFELEGGDASHVTGRVFVPPAPAAGQASADSWQLRCGIDRAMPDRGASGASASCQIDRGEFHLTRTARGTSIHFARTGDPDLGVTERADFQPAMSSFDQNRFDGARADTVLSQLRAGSAVELTFAVPPGEDVRLSLLPLKNFAAACDLMEMIFAALEPTAP
jgi:hypothetical protein